MYWSPAPSCVNGHSLNKFNMSNLASVITQVLQISCNMSIFFFSHLTIELNMHKGKTQGTIKFLNNALTSQSTLTWTIEEDVQYRNIMTSTEPIHQLLWIDINLFWKASEGKHFSKAWVNHIYKIYY